MAQYNVKFELPTGVSFTALVDGNALISPHFKLCEVANTKGDVLQPQFVINERVLEFFDCLEELRRYCGVGITVNSCYRQPAFNRKVGGSSNSLHLDGLALDWAKRNYTEAQRNNVKKKWREITEKHKRIGGINFYTGGFHLSIGEDKFGYNGFVLRDYRGTKSDW